MTKKRPLRPDSFYVRFRTVCDKVIPDSLFAELYTGFGCPPISPSVLMRLLLLMGRNKCWDEIAMEGPTTLHYFRLRLLFGTTSPPEFARMWTEGIPLREPPVHRIFEETKRSAMELGW